MVVQAFGHPYRRPWVWRAESRGIREMGVVYLVALRRCLCMSAIVVAVVFASRTYVIRSFLSFAFFSPPNAILVPGIYFLGFSRYSNCVADQQGPFTLHNLGLLLGRCLQECSRSILSPCSCSRLYTRNPRLGQSYGQRGRGGWGRSCCPRLRLRCDIVRIASVCESGTLIM